MATKRERGWRVPKTSAAIDPAGIDSLSVREEQVLSFAASGMIDKQIGAQMGVSLNTLRTYWQRIRSKVGEAPRAALAVAYIEHNAGPAAAAPEPEIAGHDWELDLAANTFRRVSDKDLSVQAPRDVDIPIEDVLGQFHPQDQPRLRSLLASIVRGDLDAFMFNGRAISLEGMSMASVYIQVVRDAEGRPVKALGRRIPMIEIIPSEIEDINIGYWSRDLVTGEIEVDEGFKKIFHLTGKEPDLREAAISRFHPDEIESFRTFVEDTVAAGKTHNRRTHRLVYHDGTVRWITTDLRIEHRDGRPRKALGTVMAFD